MDMMTPLPALLGGALIGLGASLLLVSTGRCAGVSGVIDGSLSGGAGGWRWTFLAGLVAGGVALRVVAPALLPGMHAGLIPLAVGGLLVGFGARLAGGCTSGHGIVANSRLSPRSLVATATFMTAGFVTVACIRVLGG